MCKIIRTRKTVCGFHPHGEKNGNKNQRREDVEDSGLHSCYRLDSLAWCLGCKACHHYNKPVKRSDPNQKELGLCWGHAQITTSLIVVTMKCLTGVVSLYNLIFFSFFSVPLVLANPSNLLRQFRYLPPHLKEGGN